MLVRGEGGFSIVELAVSTFMVAALGVMAIAWLGAGTRTESAADARDTAMSEVRLVRQELVRELRFAREVTAGDETSVSLWVDADVDGTVDPGESVTWAFAANGTLTRAVDGGEPMVRAVSLVPDQNRFEYEPATPPDTQSIDIHLAFDAGDLVDDAGGIDTVTSVTLRNG